MRDAGRVEEARALAVRIGKDMYGEAYSKSHLNKIDGHQSKANANDKHVDGSATTDG